MSRQYVVTPPPPSPPPWYKQNSGRMHDAPVQHSSNHESSSERQSDIRENQESTKRIRGPICHGRTRYSPSPPFPRDRGHAFHFSRHAIFFLLHFISSPFFFFHAFIAFFHAAFFSSSSTLSSSLSTRPAHPQRTHAAGKATEKQQYNMQLQCICV